MYSYNPGEDDNQNPPPPPEPTFPSDRWISESLDIDIPSQTETPNIIIKDNSQ